jgi:hypothetical protein
MWHPADAVNMHAATTKNLRMAKQPSPAEAGNWTIGLPPAACRKWMHAC